MKFIKQRNNYECSAVAIHNTLVWCGENVNYKNSKDAYYDILQLDETGVEPKLFIKLMKQKVFPFKLVKILFNCPFKEISKCVNSDTVVMLGLDYNGFGHVGLVYKTTKHYVYLANWGGTKATRKLHVKTFRKWLKGTSVAFVIRK